MDAHHDGIVLLAHGSRDPLWRRPVEAVAERLARQAPGLGVACAYIELSAPSLPEAAAALVAGGARHIRVLPLFLGVGKHAREDMPRLVDALRAEYPAVRFELRPAVGEDDRMIDLLTRIALD